MAEYHPMTVHFPLVLLILWPVLDGLGLYLDKKDLCRAGLGILAFALVGALFATLTGQAAFDAALSNGYEAELLERHTLDADLIPWLVLILVLVRVAGVQKFGKKAHLLSLVLGVGLSGFLLSVANEGGELVYQHGVGVQKTEAVRQ